MYARLIASGVIALLLAGYGWKAYNLGGNSVRVQWDADKLAIAQQSLKLSEQSTRETATLQMKHETELSTKNAKIAKLNAAVATALDSLRERPTRPVDGSLPETAAVGAGCSGRSLYAEDSRFLVSEAARADKLRIDLEACQTAYSNAHDALTDQ